MSVLKHRVTPFYGLSDGFEKRELRVMNEQKGLDVACVSTERLVVALVEVIASRS